MADLFHHKKLIETISEEQSFSKAAKRLYIPQPSLSVIVRKIEEDIGMPLFDRTTKPIRLTDAGREYLRTA
ncbi:MAG: LysR family transcriptional regulator, partial [Solobacterium sp.]|nr:LysR family transcriptional regulator [Solobacterium sp.]